MTDEPDLGAPIETTLPAEVLAVVTEVFDCPAEHIFDVALSKKGMTNRSYFFTCRGKKYLARIPGEGTDKLIDRHKEYAVYQAIEPLHLSDDVVFFDPETGYKITCFLEGSRVCDPLSSIDVSACMQMLRRFHECHLEVAHTFDIFEQIEFYESLWGVQSSVYDDYAHTKAKVLTLKDALDATDHDWTLTHIDAVPDNFLFCADGTMRLIDWEYAGMQDPHVDIAMFAIYSLYNHDQIDALIDAYFFEGCTSAVRYKIYGYIASCGLLWSNWCEYKRQLGVDFGDYARAQYRYAQEYSDRFNEQNG